MYMYEIGVTELTNLLGLYDLVYRVLYQLSVVIKVNVLQHVAGRQQGCCGVSYVLSYGFSKGMSRTLTTIYKKKRLQNFMNSRKSWQDLAELNLT